MAYKSIFTVVTEPAALRPVLTAAAAVARQEEAHLEVLCIGVDRTQVGYYYEGAAIFVQQGALDQAKEDADTLASGARDLLAREDILWSVEGVVAQIGSLASLAAVRSRFADLVILPRPYGPDRPQDAEIVLEAALFEGQAPVLVLPESGVSIPLGRRIVLAWNQSNEALSAARKALPLLKNAESVSITVVDPPRHGAESSDPGGLLCQMLVRHGVKAEVAVLARTAPKVSEEIARHARDIGADLVVMGAYGHSRFREAILGGATRNTLENVNVPVLMAH